jgi:hypothetical protein
MIDRDKVIKGLQCCRNGSCLACPYNGEIDDNGHCEEGWVDDALALLKEREPITNTSISSAIECLLHPQDADDSDMAKAIDTAVRAMRSLKAQEPRVMQISEIMEIYKADPSHVWPYNTPPYLYIQEHPHVRNSSESWAAWREIRDIIEGELFGHTAQSYGKTWRCWTAKPSSEQREGVKWGD